MTAPHIVDPAAVLGEVLADPVVGADWGQPSPDRKTYRNGYRRRDLDTRAGTLDVAIPKLRQGTYFPE